MDELNGLEDLQIPSEEAATEEETEEIVLATVASVEATGVKIQIDGDDAAGDKVYRVNAQQMFAVGDRVKIAKNSGTYIVEYALGNPMARYPIPSGGSAGQVLAKNSATNYDVVWASIGIPSGGNTGQVLAKSSNANYAVSWVDAGHGLPAGGSAGQFLKKKSNSNYDTEWGDPTNYIPAGGTSGQYLIKNGNTNYSLTWGSAPSVSELVNGSAKVSLGSSALTPNGNIALGSSTYAFNGCYIKGTVALAGNNGSLSFFGVTPTGRKYVGSSGTLATLISALQAYGLIQ